VADKKWLPSLADLFPKLRRRPIEEELDPPPSPPALAPCALVDLGDLEPVREPEWPPAPGGAPSLASRERLDLGDLEPSPAEDPVPPAPERHAVLEDLSDSGGWYVEDLGEWEDVSRTSPWQRAPAERMRRKRRYGVKSIADLPEDRSVPGRVMSYDEALRTADELDRLRETMES